PPAISLLHGTADVSGAYASILVPLNPEFRIPNCEKPSEVTAGEQQLRLCTFDGAPEALTQGKTGLVIGFSFETGSRASGYATFYSEATAQPDPELIQEALTIIMTM